VPILEAALNADRADEIVRALDDVVRDRARSLSKADGSRMTTPQLGANRYGKSGIRLVKVVRARIATRSAT